MAVLVVRGLNIVRCSRANNGKKKERYCFYSASYCKTSMNEGEWRTQIINGDKQTNIGIVLLCNRIILSAICYSIYDENNLIAVDNYNQKLVSWLIAVNFKIWTHQFVPLELSNYVAPSSFAESLSVSKIPMVSIANGTPISTDFINLF